MERGYLLPYTSDSSLCIITWNGFLAETNGLLTVNLNKGQSYLEALEQFYFY